MASNLDKERLLALRGINLVFTRVSGIFRSSASFPCDREVFSSFSGLKMSKSH